MATIYDVAKAASVSPKTVSRVLNGDAPVKAETRAAVEAAMSDLGYVPNTAARSMRSQRTGLVGLITGPLGIDGGPNQPSGLPDTVITRGVQERLAPAGMIAMTAHAGPEAEPEALIRTFLAHRMEGLIYVADYHREVSLPEVSVPLVIANAFDLAGTPSVIPDDRTGMAALTERLIAAGHRRIAYLTLDETIVATDLRRQGYEDAHRAAGLETDPALIRAGVLQNVPDMDPRNFALLSDALDAYFALPSPPTVICCGNDAMAMRLYGLLRTRGLRVPEDISVAGYDDYRTIAQTLWPPLTTVSLSYAEIGHRAAEALLDLISGHPVPAATQRVAGPVCWRSSVLERR